MLDKFDQVLLLLQILPQFPVVVRYSLLYEVKLLPLFDLLAEDLLLFFETAGAVNLRLLKSHL